MALDPNAPAQDTTPSLPAKPQVATGGYPGLAPMTPPAPQPATPAPATPQAAPLPTAAPATPSAAPAVAPVGSTQFGPGNDLRSTQINPGASPRLAGVQGQVDTAANKLASGPDRFGIAQDRFKTFAEQTDPAYQASLRSATQKAAANGAVGSGMLSTDYGNLDLARERQLSGERSSLFSNALEGTIGDTRANVGLLSGLEGQQYGQEAGARNELRGERGYQTGLEDQAYNRGIQGLTLEDALTNSAFGRGLASEQAGSTGSPAATQLGLSEMYGHTADEAGNSLAGLVNANAQSGILDNIYGRAPAQAPQGVDPKAQLPPWLTGGNAVQPALSSGGMY